MGKIRLHTRAIVLGFRRSQRVQDPGQSLLRLEGVQTKRAAHFYVGKRVAYLYKAKKLNSKGTHTHVIWGKVIATHGNVGVVRAKFRHNLPPKAISKQVRVMMYPCNI